MDKQSAIATYVYGLAILIPCLVIGIIAPSMAFIPLLMLTAGGLTALLAIAIVRHYEKEGN